MRGLCAAAFRDAGLVSRALRWAPLRWLGNMSYSYYLIHGFAVRVAMLALARLLPGTLTAGALLFVLVEKPLSLRPARRYLDTERRPALAA